MSLAKLLEQGLEHAGLQLTELQQQQLLDYLALLQKWNKVHNLTAVRDPQEMVTLHLLDSLSVMPHVQTGRLLDVGSGAGLPGIPLAMCLPQLQVTVMDASHKKASFMRQAKAELGLDNLEVVCGRVEQFKPTQKFEMVISRAFSDLVEFVGLTRHLCASDGRWLAMKGVYPYDELAQLDAQFAELHTQVIPLTVPGLKAQRHLVFLSSNSLEAAVP
jgi:16S rRNA (guanine527-N7)-methyltransferase